MGSNQATVRLFNIALCLQFQGRDAAFCRFFLFCFNFFLNFIALIYFVFSMFLFFLLSFGLAGG